MSRRSHIFVINQNEEPTQSFEIRSRFSVFFRFFHKLEFGIYCDPFDVLLIIDILLYCINELQTCYRSLIRGYRVPINKRVSNISE